MRTPHEKHQPTTKTTNRNRSMPSRSSRRIPQRTTPTSRQRHRPQNYKKTKQILQSTIRRKKTQNSQAPHDQRNVHMRTNDMPRHDPTKPLTPHPNIRKRRSTQPNKKGKMGLLFPHKQKTCRESNRPRTVLERPGSMKEILFICTHNSARSQIGEANSKWNLWRQIQSIQ